MEVTGLFVLAFLTAQVSCGRSSLTFVLDNTLSMEDEIQQVKNAAKSIVDIVLKEKSTQIEDIVLVTYGDSEPKFVKRTRDEIELKQALDSVSLQSNGSDCPKMALSGIKRALEESKPGSYLFVFTDASAKDHEMFDEIRYLCQKKQSQIVIILTGAGKCGSISGKHYNVYEDIALESNGQVFDINKDEVAQVLEYVKETIKGRWNLNTFAFARAMLWPDVQFEVDEKTVHVIVSAVGYNVDLQVLDQHFENVSSANRIMWTRNVKVLKLTYISDGTYTVRVRGNSNVNVMVFGRTDYTFDHGFSSKVETSLRATETPPTIDTESHLMVVVEDPEQSINVTSVELLDIRIDKQPVFSSLPLSRVQDNVYATDKFLLPGFTSQIVVIGTSKVTGKIVKRTAKTPVSAIIPAD